MPASLVALTRDRYILATRSASPHNSGVFDSQLNGYKFSRGNNWPQPNTRVTVDMGGQERRGYWPRSRGSIPRGCKKWTTPLGGQFRRLKCAPGIGPPGGCSYGTAIASA